MQECNGVKSVHRSTHRDKRQRQETQTETWAASSRVAVRGVQDAVVPQQGHVHCNTQMDEAHDEYINEWSQTTAWPQQGGGSFGAPARRKGQPNLMHWLGTS